MLALPLSATQTPTFSGSLPILQWQHLPSPPPSQQMLQQRPMWSLVWLGPESHRVTMWHWYQCKRLGVQGPGVQGWW